MAKFFDANGKEVEAFTAEELESKRKEAVDEYLKNNPDKSAEVTKLQSDLAEATKKLEEAQGGGNEDQKKRLKEGKDAAENALKEVTEKFTAEIQSLRDTMVSGTKTKIINALSKGDKDLAAKIELKYNSLMKTGDYKLDEAGISQAMSEAATLVTGSKPAPSFLDNMSGAGDKGAPQKPGESKPESENAKAMRTAFGITDQAAEKYSGVDATKPTNI